MADRRDSKNRKLWKGEYQKKDGRYMYKYIDANDVNRFVYSWTLTQSDRTPVGKKTDKCLRELEKEIEDSLHNQTSYYDEKTVTLNDMYDKYIEYKLNIKESTKINYMFMYDRFVRPVLGSRLVSSFKYSDIKDFYFSLVKYNNLSVSSINIINAILNPIFNEALRDGIIRTSPTLGAYADLKKILLKMNVRDTLLPKVSKSVF